MHKQYRVSLTIVLVVILVLFSGCIWPDSVPVPDTGQTGDYTATWGEDSDYTINPHSYTDLDNETVRDNVTGLEWVKDGNLIAARDPDFDQDETAGDGQVTWQHAREYIALLNNEQYLDHADWRLPTAKELATLVDAGTWLPAIDTTFFPDTLLANYWSSTLRCYGTGYAWKVCFYYGDVGYYDKAKCAYVRAVRGGQPEPRRHRYKYNADGTVTDMATGLMWQQATAPQTYTWEEALAYCEDLELAEYSDWRLPNRNELQTLVDYDDYDPAINTVFFADTVKAHYWSSTTSAGRTDHAWDVDFHSGYGNFFSKSDKSYVRAVRGGQ